MIIDTLDGLAIHIQGRMVRKSGAVVYIFTTTDNGQFVASQTTADMERAGYKVTPMADCVAKLAYMDREFFVRCDRVPPFAAPSRT